MIARSLFDAVVRLLPSGGSQRGIARQTGVSRGTVGVIAKGRHWYQTEAGRNAANGQPELSSPFSGPVERCPGCGGKVAMPCVRCRVDAAPDKRPQRSDPSGPITLQLDPHQEARRQELFASSRKVWRMACQCGMPYWAIHEPGTSRMHWAAQRPVNGSSYETIDGCPNCGRQFPDISPDEFSNEIGRGFSR